LEALIQRISGGPGAFQLGGAVGIDQARHGALRGILDNLDRRVVPAAAASPGSPLQPVTWATRWIRPERLLFGTRNAPGTIAIYVPITRSYWPLFSAIWRFTSAAGLCFISETSYAAALKCYQILFYIDKRGSLISHQR